MPGELVWTPSNRTLEPPEPGVTLSIAISQDKPRPDFI